MNVYKNCRVWYPSPAFMEAAMSWYEYPLRGFRDLGCDVTIDESLDRQSRSELGYQVTAISIAWPGQAARRVYFDWCDFESNHPHLIAKHEPEAAYCKIQCRKGMAELGIRPIGQTVARMQYLDLLEEMRGTAEDEPTHDVVAVFRTTARDLRCKAVEIIRAEPWDSIAHVRNYARREPAPSEITAALLPYDLHLQEQAASRVNIALPGVGGDWTWRHTELLGMGAFMLTLETDYLLPGDSVGTFATCKRDLSDLAVQIEWWLGHEDERRAVARRGLAYYEESLSPAAMARAMLDGVAA